MIKVYQLGVFAEKFLRCNEISPGSTSFLAPISKEEIISGYSNVSIFQHHTGEKMMLGGVAFINLSFKPNSMYSYNRQMKIVNLKVISKLGIQDGDEVTVRRYFFEHSRMYCECPHKEYHGTQITLKTLIRSGKICQISETRLEQFDAMEASKPQVKVKKPKRVHRERVPTQYRPKRPNLTQYRVKKVKESDSEGDSVDRDSISSNEPSEKCQFDSVCSPDATEFQPLLCSMPTQIMSVENFQAEVSGASNSEISSATISSPSCDEEKLYQGSLMTVTSFRSNLLSIADEHDFSERALKSALTLVESTLSPSNNLTSFHSIRNS